MIHTYNETKYAPVQVHIARYAITLMNALRYLPLSALLIVLPVMAGQDLPESQEAVCQTYESDALKKCHSLYEEASRGRLKALVNIGIAIHNQPLPDTEDWFQYNLDDISRHERAIQWFRLARELERWPRLIGQ